MATEIAAVAGLTTRIAAAWEIHDARAFAESFTPDATLILPGVYRKGREEIHDFMEAAFAGRYHGTRVTGAPVDLRFLHRDVAVVVTLGGVLAPGEQEVADERAIRATWVVVRADSDWRLAAYQNSPRGDER